MILQCRDYTCCGLQLNDLHALVEHFEECHVVVWDPRTGTYNTPIIPYTTAQPGPAYYPQGPFDPDDMEMEMDHSSGPSSSGSSPPDTPVHTPLMPYPTVSAFETTTVLPSRSGLSVNVFSSASRRNKRGIEQAEVFSGYARAKEYALALASADDQEGILIHGRSGTVTPALLLSTGTTPANSPDSSRVSSPTLSSPTYRTGNITATMTSQSTSRTNPITTTGSRPASSLLVNKPFKCPKPNCNKSYKQANGLKYHMTHGSCNFTPCKEGEMLKEGMSDSEVREIERRLRPYACGVGDCARRYKNMNGLRYHYQHSGEHGALGLALLASGQHECLIGKRTSTLNAARQQQQQQQETHAVPHNPPPTDLSHQNFYQPPHVTMQPQQAQPFSMTMWGSVNHS